MFFTWKLCAFCFFCVLCHETSQRNPEVAHEASHVPDHRCHRIRSVRDFNALLVSSGC